MSFGEYKPIPNRVTAPAIPEPGSSVVVGQLLGAFEMIELLGEGSMGQVFLGRHVQLGRQVAVKVLRPELARQSDHVGRFFQEARAVNQINDPGIVQIFDFVREPSPDPSQADTVYCVMELLRGKSLGQWFNDGGLTLQEIVEVVARACSPLQAAHGAGVVHRDIKPDNIMVDRQGPELSVKVVDFGVAKLVLPDQSLLDTTGAGAVIGTPIYMSPEQASGEAVDHRTDIYALGAVLYEGLAGHPPFQSSSFGGLFAQVIRDAAPPLPAATRAGELIPPALGSVVQACLAKDRAGRPQNMAQLARELRGVLPSSQASGSATAPRAGGARSPGAADAAEQGPEPSPAPGQMRWAWAAAPVVLVGLAGLWAIWGRGTRPLAAPAEIAVPVAMPVAAAPPTPEAPAPTPPPPKPDPEVTPPPAAAERTARAAPPDTRAPPSGELAVVTVRSGSPFFATVFVDGVRLGNSPLQRGVVAGRHRIHLTREGVPPEDRDVVVRPGETTRLRVEMSP